MRQGQNRRARKPSARRLQAGSWRRERCVGGACGWGWARGRERGAANAGLRCEACGLHDCRDGRAGGDSRGAREARGSHGVRRASHPHARALRGWRMVGKTLCAKGVRRIPVRNGACSARLGAAPWAMRATESSGHGLVVGLATGCQHATRAASSAPRLARSGGARVTTVGGDSGGARRTTAARDLERASSGLHDATAARDLERALMDPRTRAISSPVAAPPGTAIFLVVMATGRESEYAVRLVA